MDKNQEQPVSITPSKEEARRKQRQLFAFMLGFIVVLLLMLIINWVTQNSVDENQVAVSKAAPVYDVSRQIEDKSYWMYKSEQALKDQVKNQENLQKKIEELESKLADKDKNLNPDKESEQTKLLETIQKRLEQLEGTNAEAPTSQTTAHQTPNQQWSRARSKFTTQGAALNEKISGNVPAMINSGAVYSPIFSEKLTLAPKAEDPKSKIPTVDHYIPVGTFARAVLLNGVDVSVGISSQQSPQPVLMRLIDRGNLPNGAVGDMKDCRIIGAAHGDYSSERALIRVEKLSCVQKNESIIETDIGGFVVGTDGKAGIRGPMITRDGELLAQGFITGLFSGLGKAVSASTGTSSVTPFGTINTVQGKEIMKKAAGEGTGSAFELLARYSIKRLEQLQPIIQISANREVDIVFHTGSKFGEKKERVKERQEPRESSNEFKMGDFINE